MISKQNRKNKPQNSIHKWNNSHSHEQRWRQGRSQTFSFGGPLEGPVLQQGELSMVCVGLSERDLKNFGGPLGGQSKFWGSSGPPWHPPSFAPGWRVSNAWSIEKHAHEASHKYTLGKKNKWKWKWSTSRAVESEARHPTPTPGNFNYPTFSCISYLKW